MAAPYRIAIGVEVDAAKVQPGSAKATQAITGIGEAADRARPQLDKLINTMVGLDRQGANNNGRASDIAAYGADLDRLQAKFDPVFAAQQRYKSNLDEIEQARRVGAISASLAIDLRMKEKAALDAVLSSQERLAYARKQSVENVVGRQTITPNREADIAAYGAELDKLRSRFNPLYAVTVQYRQTQADIRNAHRIGAISADEMSAALSRNRQATLSSIDAIKGRNRAINETPAARNGATAFNTSNLAAQGFDVAATAAYMPWQTVALQQGPQVAQVFNDIRASGAAIGPAVAGAFMQIVNPISLVTIGAIGATAATIQYFSKTESSTKSADEVLKRHAENIEALGPAYKKAFEEQQRFIGVSADIVSARMEDNQREALKTVMAEAKAAYGSLMTSLTGDVFGSAGGQSFLQFDNARQAIREFGVSIEAGTPKVEEFQRKIVELANSGDLTVEAAAKLRRLSDEALTAENELSKVRGKNELAAAFGLLQTAIDNVNPYGLSGRLGELDSKLQDLYSRMRAGKVDSSELHRSIVNLSSANPNMSAAIEEIGKVGIAALSALKNVDALAGRTITTPKTGRVVDEAGRQAAFNFDLRTGDEDKGLVKKLEDQAERLKRENAKDARTGLADRNAYRDLIKSADDRIAQMKLEAQLAGQTGIASDALRFKLDLLQQSEEKGRSLSAAQVAAIEKRVAAFKQYAEEAAKASLQANLLFEREQFGRSAMDQQIAGALRSSGLPVDFTSTEAGLIRTNYQLQYARDLSGDFTSTLFGGLRQGEKFFDSLGDAGVKALTRISDTLMNDVLNSIFSVSNVASGSGGIGSLVSGIFGLFGAGSSIGTSSTSAWATGINAFNAKGGVYGAVTPFAKGGTFTNSIVDKPTLFPFAKGTGLMGEAGPEAIMPLTRDASGRLGVTATVSPLISGGQSANYSQPIQSGQGQKTITIKVDVTGARGNQEIKEMVSAGVQEGLAQYDAAMPDRVETILDNPRWR